MTTILTDHDLDNDAAMGLALEAIDKVLRIKAEGLLIAPPRHVVPFQPSGSMSFTIGGTAGDLGLAGFRAYCDFDQARHDQVVAVWHCETGALAGVVLGRRLGELRTGAIGGIAIKLMSRPDSATLGVVGAGRQAFMQIAAARQLRPLTRVKVYSRDADNRTRFADKIAEPFELEAEPVETARDAVRDVDIVVTATPSTSPVIEAGWLAPGTHVTSVGPKLDGASEIGLDIARAAAVIATDSAAQAHGYGKPFFLKGDAGGPKMVELDEILVGDAAGRPDEQAITLFCSTGLAGTEVHLAARLIAAMGGAEQ